MRTRIVGSCSSSTEKKVRKLKHSRIQSSFPFSMVVTKKCRYDSSGS